ncbi:MAG: TraB/GumN family protein [Oceanospirillaceae bacterium]|nr:TraB/GumN family protein [Oceanospirillaceae bacterium]MBT13263.1 TraB/GumN family protein [Oceanospirillaceae bacterium]
MLYRSLLVWLGLVCSLCMPVSVQADGAVWKVSKGSDYFYLGGSAHLLPQSDFPLPKPYETAFADTDVLVLETELPKTPAAQQAFIDSMKYADGRTLRTVLSADMYQQLEAYLAENGVALADMKRFTPGFILMLATQIESQKAGINGAGVDAYFQQRAEQGHKPIWFLEALEYQARVLAELGEDDENAFIEGLLEEAPQAKELLTDTIAAWRSGDLDKIETVVLQPMIEDDPDSYQALFVQRNHNWLRKLVGYFRNAQREFVLVGAGHLVGDEGLIELLEQQGYRLQRVN